MRAAKLAMARKMLKEHQEKKHPNDKSDMVAVLSKDLSNNIKEGAYSEHKQDIEKNVPVNKLVTPVEYSHSHMAGIFSTEDQRQEYNTSLEQQQKAMEVLTINNRALEMQVHDLQHKINHLESKYSESINACNNLKQHINTLEMELRNVKECNDSISRELLSKDNVLQEQHKSILSLTENNNNLAEQMDITKTALMAKEAENASLQSLLSNLQNKLEVTELHVQQLSHGSGANNVPTSMDANNAEHNEILLQKVAHLEQQWKSVQNEKDQISMHYEQYVTQLNEQLNSISSKHGELMHQNEILSNRENSLIDQISQMELQMQQLRDSYAAAQHEQLPKSNVEMAHTMEKCKQLEIKLKELQAKYDMAAEEIASLRNTNPQVPVNADDTHLTHNVNLTKLNADIASDKVAAQMATAQNKQLKLEVQDLKEVFVKMSNDKLELTEKLAAEKFLNRELTLKLSEIEEKAKETHSKLMAKDEEMIRLLTSYNELEKKLTEQTNRLTGSASPMDNEIAPPVCNGGNSYDDNHEHVNESCALLEAHRHASCVTEESNDALNISIKEAMLKLQERFLRNMKEVADLSDEKHRLEHIIMQLQSETDTICEYVALYQQQRGILKKREEERKEQLKIFEMERDRMKNQLDDLSRIISHFAADGDLKQYFEDESRKMEVTKIMNLVANMKSNHLVDPHKQCSDIDSFYPCSLCSGKVIIV